MELTLFLLLLKHFLIDWVIQTESEIQHKGEYGDIRGVSHSVKHGVGTFLSVVPLAPQLSVPLAVFDTLVHYHIDYTKQNLAGVLNLSPKDKNFWVLIGFDQFLHSLTYLAIVTLATLAK